MKTVDQQLGSVARPSRVHFVSALPKTRSGKLLRRAIQAICEGRDPGDLTTIEDPAALQPDRRGARARPAGGRIASADSASNLAEEPRHASALTRPSAAVARPAPGLRRRPRARPGEAAHREAADLPRFSYRIDGKVEDVVRSRRSSRPSPRRCAATPSRCSPTTTSPTRRPGATCSTSCSTLDYLEGRSDAALARIEEVRALQDKPADKLLAGHAPEGDDPGRPERRQRRRATAAPSARRSSASSRRCPMR